MVEFEWDLGKEALNIQKHGIDFTTAKLIWNGPVFERIDDRRLWRNPIPSFRCDRKSHSDSHLYMAGNNSPNHLG